MTGAQEHIHILQGDVGVKAATDVALALRQALQDHANIIVDTSAVSAADLTTVQTLLAAQRLARKEGKSLSLAPKPSEALVSALRSTGMLSAEQTDLAFWPLNPEQM